MATLPLLLFPKPTSVSRSELPPSNPQRPVVPTVQRQGQRLGPKFQTLIQTFDSGRLQALRQAQGEDPDLVLVLETIGAVDDFISSANRIAGLEWLFGEIADELQSDEDFFFPDEPDKPLRGKLFLLSTTRRALEEIISLWNRYQDDPHAALGANLGAWKSVFPLIKELRFWGPADRLGHDTRELWRDRLAAGAERIRFEVEAWCYRSRVKNEATAVQLRGLVEAAGGTVIASSLIENINYHGFLVELPAASVSTLLSDAPGELILNDRVMFLRPRGQAIVASVQEAGATASPQVDAPQAVASPIIAVLDGLPLANHPRLAGRLIVDDPDDWAAVYAVRERQHGTSVSSLIVWGELTANASPLPRQVYVRPIMRPDGPGGVSRPECTPDDILLVDLVHSAVRRIFVGAEDQAPSAPSTKIINISVGDAHRPFDGFAMSAWARLLDWLAYEHKVLFIVSAGNNADELTLPVPRESLSALPRDQQIQLATKSLLASDFHRRLFAPAESVNAVTVGALHTDSGLNAPIPGRPVLFSDGGLAPYSCLGPGFRRGIKPDVLFPGGRVRYSERIVMPPETTRIHGHWTSPSAPGLAAACPPDPAGNDMQHVRGTSYAAALATRAAARAHEVVEALREGREHLIPPKFDAVLLKALLVHGAAWREVAAQLAAGMPGLNPHRKKRLAARYAGYGGADIERVLTCTEQRATLIGVGELKNEKAVEFRVPVPISLHALPRGRKLTITLAWLTPVNARHSRYRVARLWIDPPTALLGLQRQNADHRQVRNGTVQHEVLEGSHAMPLVAGDELVFTVNCVKDASRIWDPVQFALCATLEVAEDLALPIYNEIREGIQAATQVAATVRG